ncbi:CaiB/BaiF CoA transferase family protein, partial [Chloroflexota bacterium]
MENKGQYPSRMLDAYRVLDLSDEKGHLCGRILADLGADVIKVERPGGDPSRNIGPFYKDIPDAEKSLLWFTFNANKRGVTLDIETEEGKELLKRLIQKTDFLIESFPPGYMNQIGLGYEMLKEINSRLIMTSIAPFGQMGPYRDLKATDIELQALGGFIFITGDRDRPPVRIGYPVSYLVSSIDAAVASLIALNYMGSSGEGQYIDISIQSSVYWLTANVKIFWAANQQVLARCGQGKERRPGIFGRVLWECKDGAIIYFLTGGSPRNLEALPKWIIEEGMADDFYKNYNWRDFNLANCTQELIDKLEKTMASFFLSKTKQELCEEAIRRRIIL